MSQYFDTSVLVSAFVEDERCHEECAEAVANAKDGVVSAHALAECFSILTGGRLPVRLPPDAAAQIIETNVYSRMKVVTLTARETMSNLSDCHQLGIRGGGIYDSLHLAGARKADVSAIFTLNLRHFTAFAPDLAPIIRMP